MARVFSLFLLALSLDATSAIECKGTPLFVAQELKASERSKFSYYFTARDIPSLNCCAKFCAEASFCRTAVYDYHGKTCGLVYNSGFRCHNSPQQRDLAPILSPDIPLTAIHCPICPGVGKDLNEECARPEETTRKPTRGITLISKPSTTVTPETEPTPKTVPPTTAQATIQTTTTAKTFTNPSGNDVVANRPPGGGIEALLGVLKGNGGCFAEHSQQVLVAVNPHQKIGGTFVVEQGLSLAECKCACASSWHSRRYNKSCRSIQYYPERAECFLNDVDHIFSHSTHQLAPLQLDKGSYFQFPCYRTELDTTQFVLQHCRALVPAPPVSKSGVSFGGKSSNLAHPTDYTNPCFEILAGYTLAAQAVEIREDVSMQECMCACADNKAFKCESALYNERNRICTLNLENRLHRPNLFSKAVDTRILYLGYTCSDANGTIYVEKFCPRSLSIADRRTEQFRSPPQTEEEATGLSSAAVSASGGPNTDMCFVEIPEFSLQGMAKAVKYGISLESCKCHCLFSREIFNFDCRSMQYYFDSKSCILNVHDRLDAGDRFARVRGFLKHSYFDFNCTVVGSSFGDNWRNEFMSQIYEDEVCKAVSDFDYPTAIQKRFERKQGKSAWIIVERKPVPTTHKKDTNTSFKEGGKKSGKESSKEKETTKEATKQPISSKTIAIESSSTTTPIPTTTNFSKTTIFTTTTKPTTTTLEGTVALSEGDLTGVGRCHYSTFYQMEFKGAKLLDRFVVRDAIVCVQKCALTPGCKSVNFRKFTGTFRYCELFADIPLQYAFYDVQVDYNMESAHFTGISCDKN